MNHLTNIGKSFLAGLSDSFRGSWTVISMDHAANAKQNAQKYEMTRNRIDNLLNNSSTAQPEAPTEKRDPSVLTRICNCILLNGGVFLASIALFHYFLMPFLKWWVYLLHNRFHYELTDNSWEYIEKGLGILFSLFWVIPLFLLSRVLNGLWFQRIADKAYLVRKGRPQATSVGQFCADTLFSLGVQAFFLLQSMIVGLLPIPYFTTIFYFLHMSILYGLYSFEYKWYNMGWELYKRLYYIEYNWPYFVGFGLPLTVLTSIPSSYLVSGAIFAGLFPIFILSATEASPAVNANEIYPLRLFSLVIAISNTLFYRVMPQPKPTPITETNDPQQIMHSIQQLQFQQQQSPPQMSVNQQRALYQQQFRSGGGGGGGGGGGSGSGVAGRNNRNFMYAFDGANNYQPQQQQQQNTQRRSGSGNRPVINRNSSSNRFPPPNNNNFSDYTTSDGSHRRNSPGSATSSSASAASLHYRKVR